MAFLDNSGDIILDAVLTDEGRKILSLGNGNFKIAKYALGDDEIDYSQWDGNNTSGSAYYDLNILQTPILEAFTNNASSIKSKLVTYASTDLLYLPVMKLNTRSDEQGYNTGSLGVFVCLISPEKITSGDNNSTVYGYSSVPNRTFAAGNFDGTVAPGNTRIGRCINISQGLDTTDIPFTTALSNTQKESKYLIEVDNRLVKVCDRLSNELKPSFVDDDNIATYSVSKETSNVWAELKGTAGMKSGDASPSVLAGPYNQDQLSFSLIPTENLQFSNYYFTLFGNTSDTAAGGAYTTVYSLDLNVSITGQTTGYRLDIPVRVVKFITL